MPAQPLAVDRRSRGRWASREKIVSAAIVARRAFQAARKLGCRVAHAEGRLTMCSRNLDQLGDEIAELSAHVDAATARLLDLIREFDARGGWGNGFRSCAEWLSWRVGLDPGAARERVRVARALETLPLLAGALARGAVVRASARAHSRGHARDSGASSRGVARRYAAPRR